MSALNLREDYYSAWRFLEALHGLQGAALKSHLKTVENQSAEVVDNFYHNVRCAVSHAKDLKSDLSSDKVIVPSTNEVGFNGNLFLDFERMIEYLDSLVDKMNPEPFQIIR